MKTVFNITTCSDDLDRFTSREDFLAFADGFDGVELTYLGEDERCVIPRESVVGLHMSYLPCWVDFWRGDDAALMREFGSIENIERYYGGLTRDAFLRRFRDDIDMAHRYGAEYVVFHATDSGIADTFTGKRAHTDEEVADAVAEVLNEVFSAEDGDMALLVENLWQPGFDFTRPDITRRLLDAIRHANRGVMLDTGHIFHTDNSIASEEEGLEYIHRLLDAHGELTKLIRGVHLHQSVTGAYCERVQKSPPKLAPTLEGRLEQMYIHAFAVDRHLPFTCRGVSALIERIAPEYLTFEFITESRAQLREYIDLQRAALGNRAKAGTESQ